MCKRVIFLASFVILTGIVGNSTAQTGQILFEWWTDIASVDQSPHARRMQATVPPASKSRVNSNVHGMTTVDGADGAGPLVSGISAGTDTGSATSVQDTSGMRGNASSPIVLRPTGADSTGGSIAAPSGQMSNDQ